MSAYAGRGNFPSTFGWGTAVFSYKCYVSQSFFFGSNRCAQPVQYPLSLYLALVNAPFLSLLDVASRTCFMVVHIHFINELRLVSNCCVSNYPSFLDCLRGASMWWWLELAPCENMWICSAFSCKCLYLFWKLLELLYICSLLLSVKYSGSVYLELGSGAISTFST